MDYNDMKLSVIVPVYNTSAYLEKCLYSVVDAVSCVREQTEVLVINDGSTDGSQEIIDHFCEKYPQYFIGHYKKNGGLSDVKNYGLQQARGKYVIFLDSDDYIEKSMYQEMLQMAETEDADVVVCDIRLVYDDAAKNEVRPCAVKSGKDTFSQVIDMSMMPASWNKLARRELYEGLTFPVGKNNEDVAVTPIVLARAKKICVIAKPFYNYYQRAGSIQNGCFSEKRFVILETAKLCDERIQELDHEKQEKIRGSIYLHQILALPFYPIREERFIRRYLLLKKYMQRVYELFPLIWENFEIKEFLSWENRYIRFYRRVSVRLLKCRWYCLTAVFWSVINIGFDFYLKDKKKL